MHRSRPRLMIWARLLPVILILALALPTARPALADAADYAIPGGWFFTQTGGGGGNGFAVRDTDIDSSGRPIKFWTEFQRLGGVATLGYPVGQPYLSADGFTYQPFQRGVLQWRPELNRAVLSNTFETLQAAGKDNWLYDAKAVPRPIADDGSGGDFARAVQVRLGWLTNDAIRAKFLANPNPAAISGWGQGQSIELYGLPMSLPEQHGPFVTQRFQRTTFQLWTDSVPGMPAKGTVVGVLAGDLVKEAGLLPAAAIQPLGPNATGPAQPVVSAPAPQPSAGSAAWTASAVQGWPNCGTTYVRAYARDANNNGVNDLTIKSWNDWGNEYVANTRNYNGQDGYWDRIVGSGVRAGTWYVAVFDGSGRQASNTVTVNFTGSCEPDQGNIQEAEIEFRTGSAASSTPRATPVVTAPQQPTGSTAWYVSNVQGWPNCGTTYIRAYARDAGGNGVNDITLKSWNEWGNEYVAATRNYNGQNGYWDRVVQSGPAAGRWYVAVFDGAGRQASNTATVDFTGSCDPGQPNVQEAEVEFRLR